MASRSLVLLSDLEPGDTLETCTILTTEANATPGPDLPPHARDPAGRTPTTPGSRAKSVPLAPYPADAMTFHPVSTLVNKPANDDERCVDPIAGR